MSTAVGSATAYASQASARCWQHLYCCWMLLCLPMSVMGAAPAAAVRLQRPAWWPGPAVAYPARSDPTVATVSRRPQGGVSLAPPCQLQNFQAIVAFAVAVFNSYRLAELLPLVSALPYAPAQPVRWHKRTHAMTLQTPLLCVACLLQLPLVACLALLSAFPDWVLQRVDSGAEWMMSMLLGESVRVVPLHH